MTASATPPHQPPASFWRKMRQFIIFLLLVIAVSAFLLFTKPAPQTPVNLALAPAAMPAMETPPPLPPLPALQPVTPPAGAPPAQAPSIEMPAPAADQNADLRQELQILQSKIQQLEQSLDARLRSIESQSHTPDPALMNLLIIARLEKTLASHAPFTAELEMVRRLSPNHPRQAEITATLEPYAASGLPSAEELRRQFPAVAADVMRQVTRQRFSSVSPAWAGEILAKLSSLVTVRRTGVQEGNSAEALLAQAENALSGDLGDSVAILQKLPPESRTAALQSWLKVAEGRAKIDQLLQELYRDANSALTKATS